MEIRKSENRGRTKIDWLDSRHTFSFGDYIDRDHTNFGPLRVINEDRVVPGGGFATHAHADMEILTCVLSGALEHKDSLGTGSIIRPGDLQRMSAGTGIQHSEFNASKNEPVHFLQIWIIPDTKDLEPSYEQNSFPENERRDNFRLVASRSGRDGSLTVHQDVDLYCALITPQRQASLLLPEKRMAWVQVGRGEIELNGARLTAGDGAALYPSSDINVAGIEDAEVLVFDLPNS